MKKTISWVLAIVMIITLCACGRRSSTTMTAEKPTPNAMPEPIGQFEYSQISGRSGYQYDKFDKKWVYFSTYLYPHNNFILGLSVQLDGEENGSNLAGAYLVLKLFYADRTLLGTMKSLELLIDDTVYAYETLPEATQEATAILVLYKDGYELVKALASAKDPVTVRISDYGGNQVTMELNYSEYSSSIKQICQTILHFDIWSYYIPNNSLELYESQYPLTIR